MKYLSLSLPSLLASILIATLTACSNVESQMKQQQMVTSRLAEDHGWQRLNIDTGFFVLAAFVPSDSQQSDLLTIYIEGDGLAWISSTDISPDPTPIHATALQMALHQSRGNVAYLARPCQYVKNDALRNCESVWWTDRRFAPEVIEASNNAVDQLKRRSDARQIVLIGYSGGGAVAALLAARRNDVVKLITVAGNLDTEKWTRLHMVSPLSGSLNPADYWRQLVDIPQVHYVGGRDEIVGELVARSYASRFPKDRQPQIVVIPEYDHHC